MMTMHPLWYTKLPAAGTLIVLSVLAFTGCATTSTEAGIDGAPVYTRHYQDSTPIEAVDSLLFAYRERDHSAVYFLTKPATSHTAKDRKAFLAELKDKDEWTPALWQINRSVAYTGEKSSADVTASVLSDLEGFLYNDTMRFYCFLDGDHWKIAQQDFEGESTLLGPVKTEVRER